MVLTSATLAVAGEFDYLQKRLGLPNARTLRIESPYDYASKCCSTCRRICPIRGSLSFRGGRPM